MLFGDIGCFLREDSLTGRNPEGHEPVFAYTSTKAAPWHIVPANNKWFTRLAVAGIVYSALDRLDLSFPKVTEAKKKELRQVKQMLMAEKD